jgi:hypothetical protein
MERDIAKQDLQAAVKFGTKERQVGPRGEIRWMYKFADVVFITDQTSTQEITSWVMPACGVDLEKFPITADLQREHDLAQETLADMSTWTSHSVVVVDQSGSMRNTDATGGVTRSDLTWLMLAIIMVGRQLKTGERKSTDAFSLVDMRDTGEVLLRAQPYDWILYNKLVDFLRTSTPLGPGNYIPALTAAERLLFLNKYGGCALMLTFLSDGRPSDKAKKGEGSVERKLSYECSKRISKIASRLGGRLTVGFIALGNHDLDAFVLLKSMLQAAKEYGCNCFFQPPSLSAKDLANSLTWLSSSVTSTMVQMTDVATKHQRQCKRFIKETLAEVGATNHVTDKWTVVPMKTNTVIGSDGDISIHRSIVRTKWAQSNMRRDGRSGWLTYRVEDIFRSKSAVGVAFKNRWFGEGAERLVKEFREYDTNLKFVGPAMVAKDSKYIINKDDKNDEREFHRVFIKTQQKAQQLAEIFNRKLESLHQLKGINFPRIEFLECSVYMLQTPSDRRGYLVEKMLDIKRFKYTKWNDNAGRVMTQSSIQPIPETVSFPDNFHIPICETKHVLTLDPILEECSDPGSSCDEFDDGDKLEIDGNEPRGLSRVKRRKNEEDSEDGLSSEEDFTDGFEDDAVAIDFSSRRSIGQQLGIKGRWGGTLIIDEIETNVDKDASFETEDIPQAFSCFTYLISNRNLLVCDLQGVLNTDRSPPIFELTDPVIHRRTSNCRGRKFGRTDKDLTGIHDFFKTHQHNNLCRMLRHQYPKKTVWANTY